MARIEWVRQRLENWALWQARMKDGGLGFASQSSFLREVDSSRYREAFIPVDETEAAVTDEAVATLKLSHEHLHRTIIMIYLTDTGVKQAARELGRAESTVYANLAHGDAVLSVWFTDRKRRQAEARAAFERKMAESKRSFTP